MKADDAEKAITTLNGLRLQNKIIKVRHFLQDEEGKGKAKGKSEEERVRQNGWSKNGEGKDEAKVKHEEKGIGRKEGKDRMRKK